jgi:hypothetical protein
MSENLHRNGSRTFTKVAKRKKSPEGGSGNWIVVRDQARRSAGPLLLRRQAMKPIPANPSSSMAHVEDSGTDVKMK